jgi:hypothetical protein
MPKPQKNIKREQRIQDEIIVDAHDSEEQAMGWYYYLDEELAFPFTATCIAVREISPLRKGDEVEVWSIASEDTCRHEMFVMMQWEKPGLAVPLSQLKPISNTDRNTKEAVADWHYWMNQGHVL